MVLKNKWVFLGINFSVVTLLFFMRAPVYDLFHYINQTFYVAFFYLFGGLLLWVIRGGFFDSITYSFRRFYHRVAKTADYMEDWKKKPLPSQTIDGRVLKFFLFQGMFMNFGMIGMLIYYYQG
ncbi:DUF3899 domain-containing protein [Halobacillus sp. MO56]